jgi:membrane associated rhomboid family serine protease
MNNVRLSQWHKIPPAILNLIIINCIIFLAQQVFIGANNQSNLTNILGLHYFKDSNFRIWQIITHWFCHANLSHLLGNMVMLWLFGSKIENLMGAKKFLIIYGISGLGASLLHLCLLHFEFLQIQSAVNNFNLWPTQAGFNKFFQKYLSSEVFTDNYVDIVKLNQSWLNDPFNTQFIEPAKEIMLQAFNNTNTGITIGASGAVCGIMAAVGYLFPNDRFYGYLPFPLKFVLPFVLIFEIYYGAFYSNGSNIAHFAHAGGIIFGFIGTWLINKIYKRDFY